MAQMEALGSSPGGASKRHVGVPDSVRPTGRIILPVDAPPPVFLVLPKSHPAFAGSHCTVVLVVAELLARFGSSP